ncbi:hypothetical protein [Paracoccus cavernae]
MTVYQKEGPAMTYRIALGRTPRAPRPVRATAVRQRGSSRSTG